MDSQYHGCWCPGNIIEQLIFSSNSAWKKIFIPPASTKLKGGYTGITLSVCPSVDRIVSALYLQQYSLDLFHICASYQATSEGVSRVMPVSKFKHLKFWRIFKICNFDFVFFWLGIQYDSLVWVIIRRRGYPQNAGVLVVLVVFHFRFHWIFFLGLVTSMSGLVKCEWLVSCQTCDKLLTHFGLVMPYSWVSKSRKIVSAAQRTKTKKSLFFVFIFWDWCNTCINVTVFDSGSKFLLKILVISPQKAHEWSSVCIPENRNAYRSCAWRTKKFSLDPLSNFLDMTIRRQAIIKTNAGLLSIGPLGTNFSEIQIKVQNFSFIKMHLKMFSAKWQPFSPGGDELIFKEYKGTDYLI